MNLHELRVADDHDRGPAYAAFARVIVQHQLSAGVAVGVRYGGLAEAVLEMDSVDELLGIDAYDAADAAAAAGLRGLAAEQLENAFWYVMGRLSRFGPRYNHVRGSSAQGAQVLNVELDFVYLDADTPQRVPIDLPLWFPKLRAGGVIGGAAAAQVRGAVEQFLGPQSAGRINVTEGDAWWVRKDV
jgi:hypothetical protein